VMSADSIDDNESSSSESKGDKLGVLPLLDGILYMPSQWSPSNGSSASMSAHVSVSSFRGGGGFAKE
jgi:hypothetical protein